MKGTKYKAVCKISVGTPVSKITTDKEQITLETGVTEQIQVTVLPKSAANKSVAYESDNDLVAIVDKNGLVTAKSAGTAVVTIQSKDGSNKKTVVKVTVTEKKTPKPDVPVKPEEPVNPETPSEPTTDIPEEKGSVKNASDVTALKKADSGTAGSGSYRKRESG